MPELNYITQIVFILFEDLTQPEKSEHRFRVHIHFSPGVRCRDELSASSDAAAKFSPELSSKPLQLQVVTRQPPAAGSTAGVAGEGGVAVGGAVGQKPTDTGGNSPNLGSPIENADTPFRPPLHKELVVRRKSDVSFYLGSTVGDGGRFKSFSETEFQKIQQTGIVYDGTSDKGLSERRTTSFFP